MNKKIFKDFWIKFISVVFAITLWFFVVNEKVRRVSVNVPISASVPAGIEVSPDTVKVTLEAEFREILRLNSGDVVITGIPYVRLGKAAEDEGSIFEIKSDHIFAPSGFRVVSIEPAEIKLTKKPTYNNQETGQNK